MHGKSQSAAGAHAHTMTQPTHFGALHFADHSCFMFRVSVAIWPTRSTDCACYSRPLSSPTSWFFMSSWQQLITVSQQSTMTPWADIVGNVGFLCIVWRYDPPPISIPLWLLHVLRHYFLHSVWLLLSACLLSLCLFVSCLLSLYLFVPCLIIERSLTFRT